MRAAILVLICALAGCATMAEGRAFPLSAEQVSGGWSRVVVRAWREAEAQGIDPLWDPLPRFSAAQCRWLEPGRKAHCRYRVSRGLRRPGHEPAWIDEEADLYLTDRGWDFGG